VTNIELVYLPDDYKMVALDEHELEDGRHEPVDELLDQLELLRDEPLAQMRVVRR
jgi:hypothetical protein